MEEDTGPAGGLGRLGVGSRGGRAVGTAGLREGRSTLPGEGRVSGIWRRQSRSFPRQFHHTYSAGQSGNLRPTGLLCRSFSCLGSRGSIYVRWQSILCKVPQSVFAGHKEPTFPEQE